MWHQEVVEMLPKLRDTYRDHGDIINTLNEFEKTFLYPGSQEYFEGIIPKDSETVLAHNDAQENNILASLYDTTHIIFIDFEYTSWNPRAMDIANYFSETMLDNAHPLENGIKPYIQNFINEREQEFLIRCYLQQYFRKYYNKITKISEESFIENELPILRAEVHKCLLLNNYFWGVWSIRMLKPEKIGETTVFNFDFAKARVAMFNHVKSLYF